jgi:hypothetical protein
VGREGTTPAEGQGGGAPPRPSINDLWGAIGQGLGDGHREGTA